MLLLVDELELNIEPVKQAAISKIRNTLKNGKVFSSSRISSKSKND